MCTVPCKPRVGKTFIVVHNMRSKHDRYAMAVYQDEQPGGSHRWTSTSSCTTQYVCHTLENLGTFVTESSTETFRRYQLTSDA